MATPHLQQDQTQNQQMGTDRARSLHIDATPSTSAAEETSNGNLPNITHSIFVPFTGFNHAPPPFIQPSPAEKLRKKIQLIHKHQTQVKNNIAAHFERRADLLIAEAKRDVAALGHDGAVREDGGDRDVAMGNTSIFDRDVTSTPSKPKTVESAYQKLNSDLRANIDQSVEALDKYHAHSKQVVGFYQSALERRVPPTPAPAPADSSARVAGPVVLPTPMATPGGMRVARTVNPSSQVRNGESAVEFARRLLPNGMPAVGAAKPQERTAMNIEDIIRRDRGS